MAFKPCHKISAELGGHASKGNESGDNWWHAGTPEEEENKHDKWITLTGYSKTKKILNPKPKPKLHNAFAILSQPNAPTYYDVPSPAQQMDDDRIIIPPSTQEHRRQQKLPCTSTSNKHYGGYKKLTICSSTTASLTPRMNAPPSPRATTTMQSVWQSILPCTTWPTDHRAHPTRPQYSLPLWFRIQLDYKKLKGTNMSVLPSRTRYTYLMWLQHLVSCWHDTTLGPTDTTSVNKTNAKQASLFCDHLHNGLGSSMVAQVTQNMSPNSPFANYLHVQGKQTHSRTSPHL